MGMGGNGNVASHSRTSLIQTTYEKRTVDSAVNESLIVTRTRPCCSVADRLVTHVNLKMYSRAHRKYSSIHEMFYHCLSTANIQLPLVQPHIGQQSFGFCKSTAKSSLLTAPCDYYLSLNAYGLLSAPFLLG